MGVGKRIITHKIVQLSLPVGREIPTSGIGCMPYPRNKKRPGDLWTNPAFVVFSRNLELFA